MRVMSGWVPSPQSGRGSRDWREGDRLYGDVYGGYADYALIPVEPIAWSRGPLRLPSDLPSREGGLH